MKLRTLAWITFVSFFRNKLIILFFAVFLGVILLFMTPLLTFKSMATDNPAQVQAMIVSMLSLISMMVSGFGSLLAAWAAADAVASEMRTGTIMAVMARPVRRWEFLLGKYIGVEMLMLVYVAFMVAVTYIMAGIAGQRLVTNPWVLVVYPMVRYSLYAAIAIWMVTFMHPILAFVVVLIWSALANAVSPGSSGGHWIPDALRSGLYYVLPSAELLSESNFLAITTAALKQRPWTDHLTALAYGLDYALVCFLLAAWSFRRRSLARE